MRIFKDVLVQPLTEGDIRPLFPVMREVEPLLQLSQWIDYATRMLRVKSSRPAGVLVVRRRGLLACGAACFRPDRDLRFGLVLTIQHFVALDMLYPQVMLAALLAELEALAVRFDCVAIQSHVETRSLDTMRALSQAGHHRNGTMLTKIVV